MRTHRGVSLQGAVFRTQHATSLQRITSTITRRRKKGLGVGASVRALPEAGKERLFEHEVRVLAPSANGFARIAPETPALDFSFVTFLCIKAKEK